jgi:hypothetical protein
VPVLDDKGEVIVFKVGVDRRSALRMIRTGYERREALGRMFDVLRDAVIEHLVQENTEANKEGSR